jgi:hypothetical protein
MLNKGAHVVRAVEVLDDLLPLMEAHQTKKRSRRRASHSWLQIDTFNSPAYCPRKWRMRRLSLTRRPAGTYWPRTMLSASFTSSATIL